jgi:hypothetical protein
MRSALAPAMAFLLLPLVTALASCDDDAPTGTGDTGVADQGDMGGDADADATGGDATGGDVTGDPDGAADAGDLTDEPVERTCGRPAARDETALYDVLSPLAEFVGEAEVTRAGLDVSVVIPDPDDPESPTTFEGSFEAGERCVAAEYDGIPANLCFFNADGTPAEPESLGAQIFAFIAGGPTDRPNPALLGGVRRGLDLSCSLAGFFALDTSALVESGDLPAEVAPAVRERLLAYVAVFEGASGRVYTAMGEVPAVELAVEASPATGALEVDLDTALTLTGGGAVHEWEVQIGLVATLELASGTLSGVLTVGITGAEASGTLAGAVTGERR